MINVGGARPGMTGTGEEELGCGGGRVTGVTCGYDAAVSGRWWRLHGPLVGGGAG